MNTRKSIMANLHNGDFVTLYSSKAHVFQINPETKNTWLQKVEQAIPFSIVATLVDEHLSNEPSKKELRIIGTGEKGSTILDTVIHNKTTFTKRTAKFGQWMDHTGTIYGLGFNSEAEMTEFVEAFEQIQKDRLSAPPHNQQPQQNHSLSNSKLQPQLGLQSDRLTRNQQLSNGETNGRYQSNKNSVSNMQQYSNTLAHPGHQQLQTRRNHQLQSANNTVNVDATFNNGNSNNFSNDNGKEPVAGASSNYQRSQSMMGLQGKTNNNNIIERNLTPDERNLPTVNSESQLQLKYENERLKEALEESAKNAGSWHNELQNLRTNNAKLTQALQESKAHVKEWERELSGLRDENNELKLRLFSLESTHDSGKDNDIRRDLIQKYSDELKRKDKKIEELTRDLDLRDQSLEQEGQLELGATQFILQSQFKQRLETIVANFESKVRGFIDLQKELESIIKDV